MWNFATFNLIFAVHFLKNKFKDFLQNLSRYATWCSLSFERVYRNFMLSKFCNIKIIKKSMCFLKMTFYILRLFASLMLKSPSNFCDEFLSSSIAVIYVIFREIVVFVLENDTGIYEWFLKQNFRNGKRKIPLSCCPKFCDFSNLFFWTLETPYVILKWCQEIFEENDMKRS